MKLGKASIALAVVATAVLLAAIAVVGLNRDDDVQRAPDTAPRPGDAELVARGEYLVRAGSCYGCHTEPGGAPYAGGRAIETPFGIVNAPNLTADADRLGGVEQRRLLARPAQRPLARRAAALSRLSRTRTTRVWRAPTPTRCSRT